MTIASIGEILWDVFPDSERLGGASLNFAVHAARLGHRVIFLSAVGDDDRGRAARERAAALGLPAEFIQVASGAPTGVVTVRLNGAGLPDFTIHRPAAYDRLRLGESELARLAALAPEWIYYGTLYQSEAQSRAETEKLLAALPRARRFYDVNLRRDSWTPALVEELMRGAHAVKLNEDEAAEIDAHMGRRHGSLEAFTAWWAGRLGWQAVAVTRGEQGCAVRIGTDYAEAPGKPVTVADTVGAGDAFAAAFLHGLGQGWDAHRTGDFANRLGALVASRAGGTPAWTPAELEVADGEAGR
jgi:fructokinase